MEKIIIILLLTITFTYLDLTISPKSNELVGTINPHNIICIDEPIHPPSSTKI